MNERDPIRPSGLRRRVIRNLAVLMGGSGGAALLSLGSVALVARALPLADFGNFVLFQTTALLLAGLFNFSTQQPVIKLGVDALERGDTLRFERLVAMGLLTDLASAVGAAAVACGAVLAAPVLLGLSADRVPAALLVAASLLFQGYRTSEGVFRAFDRFDQLGILQVGAAAIQLAIALVLWSTAAPFVAFALLAAISIALPSLLQLAGAILLLRRQGMRPAFRGGLAAEDRREFAAYCTSTWLTGSMDTVRQNGDTPLVGAILSAEAAGIYNIARQLAGVLRKGVQVYASVLFPELAAFASRKDTAGPRRLLGRVLRISIVLTAILVAGAAVTGDIALELLFGAQFSASHTALVLLVAAAGIQLISATYSMYLQAFVGPTAITRAYFVALLAFLVTIVPGLWLAGTPGAGAAQIIFFIILTIACRSRLRRAGAMEDKPA